MVVVVDSVEGRRLELSDATWRFGAEEVWEFRARLVGPTFDACVDVYEHGAGLAAFFDTIAADIGGWDGVKTYASLEGQLDIAATHDHKGLIICEVASACSNHRPGGSKLASRSAPARTLNGSPRDRRVRHAPLKALTRPRPGG